MTTTTSLRTRSVEKPLIWAIAIALFFTSGWAAAGTIWHLPGFESLVQSERDSVVDIQTRRTANPVMRTPQSQDDMAEFLRRFREFQKPPNQTPRHPSQGIGSGVIASKDGYILTNAHVVDGATAITVRLFDQREPPATLVGTEPRSDIAILKIEAEELLAVTFGDSDKLRVGQWVLAIGAPFGLEQTTTQGIVSAISRSLPNDN